MIDLAVWYCSPSVASVSAAAPASVRASTTVAAAAAIAPVSLFVSASALSLPDHIIMVHVNFRIGSSDNNEDDWFEYSACSFVIIDGDLLPSEV